MYIFRCIFKKFQKHVTKHILYTFYIKTEPNCFQALWTKRSMEEQNQCCKCDAPGPGDFLFHTLNIYSHRWHTNE